MTDGLSAPTKEITDLLPYLSQLKPEIAAGISAKVHGILFKLCACLKQDEEDRYRELERRLYIAEKAVADSKL